MNVSKNPHSNKKIINKTVEIKRNRLKKTKKICLKTNNSFAYPWLNVKKMTIHNTNIKNNKSKTNTEQPWGNYGLLNNNSKTREDIKLPRKKGKISIHIEYFDKEMKLDS